MKFRIISLIFILFSMFSLPISVKAQGVKPDLRNYDAFVDERPMPSVPCAGKTPREWVAEYVGYNQLAGNNMKFSEYLFGMADQVDRAAVLLAPKIFTDGADKAANEPGNPVAWVGEICWYQPDLKDPIISPTIIESATPITQVFKKIRDGNAQLSAFNALYHIPLSGETYPMEKPPLSPDPNKQSKCPAQPSGIVQSSLTDKGQGKNTFAPSWGLDILCATICQCEMTKMFIRTDSFIPYNTPPLCTGPGCTDEQIEQVDSKSAPTELEKKSKGWMNAVVRPGLMDQIIVMVEKLAGSITGKVPQQATKNNVNEPTEDSSYYTTMGHEISMKYTNCTLFPYNTRELYKMPECYTNWLSNSMVSVINQLRGTLSQNVAEPTQ